MYQVLPFQAHKLTLAEGSPWFHKLFQSGESMKSVVLFGVTDKVAQAAVDLIYGKEIIFPSKEKQRLTWFLTKLGVKWCDKETLDETVTKKSSALDPVPAPCSSNPQISEMEPSKTSQLQNTKKQLHGQKDPLQHPETVEQKSYENQSTQMEEEAQNTARQNEFYAILDQFTETNDEELAKISHMLIGEDGKPDRRYKCLNCEKSSNFFTQAQRHHLEHKHSELSFVRETLKGVFTEK